MATTKETETKAKKSMLVKIFKRLALKSITGKNVRHVVTFSSHDGGEKISYSHQYDEAPQGEEFPDDPTEVDSEAAPAHQVKKRRIWSLIILGTILLTLIIVFILLPTTDNRDTGPGKMQKQNQTLRLLSNSIRAQFNGKINTAKFMPEYIDGVKGKIVVVTIEQGKIIKLTGAKSYELISPKDIVSFSIPGLPGHWRLNKQSKITTIPCAETGKINFGFTYFDLPSRVYATAVETKKGLASGVLSLSYKVLSPEQYKAKYGDDLFLPEKIQSLKESLPGFRAPNFKKMKPEVQKLLADEYWKKNPEMKKVIDDMLSGLRKQEKESLTKIPEQTKKVYDYLFNRKEFKDFY